MPEVGLNWLPRKELLTFEEMLKVCSLLTYMGIEKIRITGGEPFVRQGIMEFLTAISKLEKLKELTLTTNGLLTEALVPELKKMGIRSINLSLDTLDRNRFLSITKRDELHKVLGTLEQLLVNGIEVKLNAVVMENINTMDIIPLTDLTKELPISVRFIEEMPFNGSGNSFSGIAWDHIRIYETIRDKFPSVQKCVDPAFSTANNYQIPGHKGKFGIIAAYSRTFCGTCNRLRITPDGILKTCLYDKGVLSIKQMIRNGSSDSTLQKSMLNALSNRTKDGWEAEKNHEKNSLHESMASIGG